MGIQFTIQGGGQFSIKGFNIPWMKIDPGVNLTWGSKYHMTQKQISELKNENMMTAYTPKKENNYLL